MTSLILTFGFTFVLIVVAMLVFIRIGAPVYRVERENIVALLELVINEKATEQDWDVFMAIPIRHNDELSQVQRRCHDIAQAHYVGGTRVFSDRGRQLLAQLLSELKQEVSQTEKDG